MGKCIKDIELVIKIPEEVYERFLSMRFHIPGRRSGKSLLEDISKIIRAGTPLPKGHGRLVDEKDLSLMTVHMIDGMFVCDAPTIIEADKGRK